MGRRAWTLTAPCPSPSPSPFHAPAVYTSTHTHRPPFTAVLTLCVGCAVSCRVCASVRLCVCFVLHVCVSRTPLRTTPSRVTSSAKSPLPPACRLSAPACGASAMSVCFFPALRCASRSHDVVVFVRVCVSYVFVSPGTCTTWASAAVCLRPTTRGNCRRRPTARLLPPQTPLQLQQAVRKLHPTVVGSVNRRGCPCLCVAHVKTLFGRRFRRCRTSM